MAETNRIRKIKLSDNKIYSIFDAGALRLNADKKLLTGDTVVDEIIIQGKLSVTEVDDVPIADITEKVLVTDANGNIKQEDIRQVLKQLGLITAAVENAVLTLDVIDIPEGTL